jgi:type IV pilus assembly protein PilM
LRRIFKAVSKPLIGLDVSASSLKWVELAQDDKAGLVLEHCVMEPLQVGWMAADHIAQFDEVVAALRRLVKASGSQTRQVALAMPDSAVSVSKIRLPADLGEAELLRQVEAEVERLSGRPWADMHVDYSVQGRPQAPSQGAEVEVWIAAAANEKVQDRLGLAEAAGLEAVILDVAAEAAMLAARRLIPARQSAPTHPVMALIQVDTEGWSLHVTYQGAVVHATRQPLHNADRHQCQEALQVAYAPAVITLSPLLTSFILRLADHLASALDGFLSTAPHRKIDTILLAGGSPWLAVLQQALKQRTFSDCLLVDAFSGMRVNLVSQNAACHAGGRSSMLTACGLALRRFHGA